MRRATPTVSLLLVGVCLLSLSGPVAASATSNRRLHSHGEFSLFSASVPYWIAVTYPGASGRRMSQEPDQLPTERGTEEDSLESTQQSALVNSTDTSVVHLNTTADTADASEPQAARSEGAGVASPASEPNTAIVTDSKGEVSETSADRLTSANRQLPGVSVESDNMHQHASSKSGLQREGLPGNESEDASNSADSLQHAEDAKASADAKQASASPDADQPKSDALDDTTADKKQEADLTFDEALAQTALGAELSDRTSGNTSSSNQSSSDDLTFDQALAATNKTQSVTDVIANSTHSIVSQLKHADPRALSPVLESLLPSTESLNGSLHAAIQESEEASSATATNSSDENTLNATHWTGFAGAAVSKAAEAVVKTANASTSLLDKDVLAHPSNSSIVNATRGTVTGAASAAAGALATASITVSNATAALAAATNTTAVNVTNTTMVAGGAESDALLGNEVLNGTVAHGVLHSGADKVTGALSGVKSWLSSSKADDVKQGLQNASTASWAAAAELGTEESGLSGRKRPPPSYLSADEAELENSHLVTLPANASVSSTAANRTSSTSGALPTAGARQSATPAENLASARLIGANGSTDAVVAAALANPKGSASKAATVASQRAAEEERAEAAWSLRQQATAGSSGTGTHAGATQSGNMSQAGTSASALGLESQPSRDDPLQGAGASQARQAALGKKGGLHTSKGEDQNAPLLGQLTHSALSSAGSNALPRVKPVSSQASGTLTPAQQRELERESAYQASTGKTAAAVTDSSTPASGQSTASHLSWSAIASQNNTSAAQGDPTSGIGSEAGSVGNYTAAELRQGSAGRQQSMGDSENDADMEDYDPRSFATGSTESSVGKAGVGSGIDPMGQAWDPRTAGASTGSRVEPSMGGDERYGQEGDIRHFMVNRDPTDPRSVVGAQQSRGSQAQRSQQDSAASNAAGTGGGMAAGKTKISLTDDDEVSTLLAGAQAASQSASRQSVPVSGDELAGPVVKGVVDDKLGSSKQSRSGNETLHGLLDNIIDNWVVITALSALACTGAVLGFMFLRGFVPSPYDAINISNSGNGGYAGNNGYLGVSREDEENGWEGWAEGDVDSNSQVKKSSTGNSPPRGTGVGKLKKGTFAKKKPANWSNDF